MIDAILNIFPDSFSDIKILITITYFSVIFIFLFYFFKDEKSKELHQESKWFIVPMLIGLFVPYYVIDYLFLPENPRICIDNYSSEDVKVYLNDTYVIDILAQENLL